MPFVFLSRLQFHQNTVQFCFRFMLFHVVDSVQLHTICKWLHPKILYIYVCIQVQNRNADELPTSFLALTSKAVFNSHTQTPTTLLTATFTHTHIPTPYTEPWMNRMRNVRRVHATDSINNICYYCFLFVLAPSVSGVFLISLVFTSTVYQQFGIKLIIDSHHSIDLHIFYK